MIDCSSGQVSAHQKPTYGRMYQTPFADRIRNEAGIATIAVGAISRGRPRQQHHRRRPRRPVRGGAPAPGQPGLDADRGGEDRLHRRSTGRASTAPPSRRWKPTSSARRRRARRPPSTREPRDEPHDAAFRAPAPARRPRHRPGGACRADDHLSLKLWLRLLACSTQVETEVRQAPALPLRHLAGALRLSGAAAPPRRGPEHEHAVALSDGHRRQRHRADRRARARGPGAARQRPRRPPLVARCA